MSRQQGTRQVTLTSRDDRGPTGRDMEDLKITISDSGSDGATKNVSPGQADDHTVKPPTDQWTTVTGRKGKNKNTPRKQSHNRGGSNHSGFLRHQQQPKHQNHHQQQKRQQHPPQDPQHQIEQQQQQQQKEPVHYDIADVMGGCQSRRSKADLKITPPIKIKEYTTNSGLNIICYTGDVTAAGAEGIVTAEGCGMTNPSMVTQSLLKVADIDYGNLKTAVIRKFGTVDLKVGEVYCLQTLEYGIKLQFKSIFLAIVLPFEKDSDEYSWKRRTVHLYYKLLNEADKNGLKSLAIPLLGSGKAGAPMELAIEALVTALGAYQTKSLSDIMLVSFNEKNLSKIIKQWDEYSAKQSRCFDLKKVRKTQSVESVERSKPPPEVFKINPVFEGNVSGYNGDANQSAQSQDPRHLASDHGNKRSSDNIGHGLNRAYEDNLVGSHDQGQTEIFNYEDQANSISNESYIDGQDLPKPHPDVRSRGSWSSADYDNMNNYESRPDFTASHEDSPMHSIEIISPPRSDNNDWEQSQSGSDGATKKDSSGQADDHTVKPSTVQWKTVTCKKGKHKTTPQQQSHNRGGRNHSGFRRHQQWYLPPKHQNLHQKQKQQQHPPQDPQHQVEQQQHQQQQQQQPKHQNLHQKRKQQQHPPQDPQHQVEQQQHQQQQQQQPKHQNLHQKQKQQQHPPQDPQHQVEQQQHQQQQQQQPKHQNLHQKQKQQQHPPQDPQHQVEQQQHQQQQQLQPKHQNLHQKQKQQQHPPQDPQHQVEPQQHQQQQQQQQEPVHYNSADVMGGYRKHRSKAHLKIPSSIKIEEYTTNSGLNIICYTGDVTAADAEGIVTAEGCGMNNPSMVTQSLLKMAGIDYGNLATVVINKYGTVDLKVGEVYCLHTREYGIKLQFKSIFLAIVLPFEDTRNKNYWKSHTVHLYFKLLSEADKNGLKSLAIPLLGSGKAGAPMELAIEALVTYIN
ncbi:uncharacterized protein LOC121376755 [Gigantopelta aegis]|uniref:uncharacterized protein LOC121376755 n=1 Tax=Gigantopelta aegis TaxID=1735272 RepID=UPI001B88CE03|nr:uncharacterized protein LOC121376755 [Gigantopelta aegis]XP_041360457.1 uncharacterized protein LOC121376755 [Gigantopelta aegis]